MAVDKKKIEEYLDAYFTIDGRVYISPKTGLVSVTGHAQLTSGYVNVLPVSFSTVTGTFTCSGLKTLKGVPRHVGKFHCVRSSFETLKYAPERVDTSFILDKCHRLKNLIGAPKHVGDSFDCSDCANLESLQGCPEYIGGSFWCDRTSLKTLEGGPRYVGGLFECGKIKTLESLQGAPDFVADGFYATYVPRLKNIHSMPNTVGHVVDISYTASMGLCVLLLYRRVTINHAPPTIKQLLEKYANTGYAGMLPFANELIHAGYGDNAWL
jgi:hypothetical protein